MQRRLLFVDDEENLLITMAAVLEKHGLDVSVAASVPEALQKITSQKFDVLLSDLNIGNPGDGLTVVSAMRRTQPEAVTIILTGYPAFETALEAIRQQVDDYIVKPANIPALVNAIESKLEVSPRRRPLPPSKRVAMLLQEHVERIEDMWLSFVEKDPVLSRAPSTRDQRLHHLRGVLEQVIRAAQYYSGEQSTERHGSALAPGVRRDFKGYTASMVFTEFCLLRRVIGQIIQENLLAVNLSYLMPDLDRIHGNLDDQAQAALTMLSE